MGWVPEGFGNTTTGSQIVMNELSQAAGNDEISSENAEPQANAWRLLFVGGSLTWFQQIERDLGCIQPTWVCLRADDSGLAMDALTSDNFNALIIESSLSDGVALLRVLAREITQTVCLVRCDITDRAAVARWDQSGATPLADVADAAMLAATVKRSVRLREWMLDPGIKMLLPQIHKLPTSPKLHEQVTKELKSEDGSFSVVADLISEDPVMSAKILQVANSALFSPNHEVTDANEAVMLLGSERIRSLILLAGVFSQYANARCTGFSPEPIWSHSLEVGTFARNIALAETKDEKIAEAAFTAGLLHDIGKLILAGNVPDMYSAVRREQIQGKVSSREAEINVMGTTHAELGACLLGTWGLPLTILEAIARHHQPSRFPDAECALLAFVHAANIFTKEKAKVPNVTPEPLDIPYLARVGFGDCANRWRTLCGVPPQVQKASAEEMIQRRRDAKVN